MFGYTKKSSNIFSVALSKRIYDVGNDHGVYYSAFDFIFFKKESESNFFTADGIISGVMNGVANYIVLYLAAFENATVLFPIVSVINIVAVCLLGSLIFKEKLTTRGIIGILIGITAVIMLKLN